MSNHMEPVGWPFPAWRGQANLAHTGRAAGSALLAVLLALPLMAAQRAETQCWFENGYLYATGLPTTYPYSVTTEPIPTGTTTWSVDGTLAVPASYERAYFWVRGHGPSLIKAGSQLNDYHVICIAEAA